MTRWHWTALVVAMTGCGHSEPVSPPPFGTDSPFDAAPPVRLTLNAGNDRSAAWLPDGTGLLYSAQQLARPDHDLCLALLPPGGGRQRGFWCDVPGGVDVTDAVESPAAGEDGRLAFVAASGTINGASPGVQMIQISPFIDPTRAITLRALPFTIGGTSINGVTQLRWLGADRLVFLGLRVVYRKLCFGCPIDTVAASHGVDLLPADGQAGPEQVPGTDLATGVAALSADDIGYTLAGDSRVYRRNLTTGAVEVLHDFGAAGPARDIHVAGNRLVAVVGGRVAFGSDGELGPIQVDNGGLLRVVDLDSGGDLLVEVPGLLFRRPAMAPSGDRIVVEGYRLTLTEFVDPVTAEVHTDTTVSRESDLFLLGGS